MRTITKRLTVKNDGFTKTEIKANIRINNVVNRYVAKMSLKGWIPTHICGGNAFDEYENIIHISKPKDDLERTQLHDKALECGWTFKDDGYSWN